jgi:MOSC domain-containing protein YiiM
VGGAAVGADRLSETRHRAAHANDHTVPMHHPTTDELLAGMTHVRLAPATAGTLDMIVIRPAVDEREVLDEVAIDPAVGLVGDTWSSRPSSRTPDRSPHPGAQVTLIARRAVELFAGDRSRWPLAGDQLVVDLDLGEANLPAGTRLAIGTAVLEVSGVPHTGCAKFRARFGADASRFLVSPDGVELRLRGINTGVVTGGVVRVGDAVHRIEVAADARA